MYTFGRGNYGNIYHIPSAQHKEKKDSRLPGEDEHKGRQEDHTAQAGKGTEKIDGVIHSLQCHYRSVNLFISIDGYLELLTSALTRPAYGSHSPADVKGSRDWL